MLLGPRYQQLVRDGKLLKGERLKAAVQWWSARDGGVELASAGTRERGEVEGMALGFPSLSELRWGVFALAIMIIVLVRRAFQFPFR